MEHLPNRAEADRLIGIAEKLLQNRDLNGSRDFAILAQENDSLLEGADQILAVVDVLHAAEKRINNHHDWYAILQVDRQSGDHELIKKQYRRLALLLHPDKNRYAFADQAFKLVADAWNVLSDQTKKSLYDKELGIFSRVDLTGAGPNQQVKVAGRRGRPPGRKNRPKPEKQNSHRQEVDEEQEAPEPKRTTFWTTCPYCYVLYEYPSVYEGCCLKCQKCERSFHGVTIPKLPPLVPGQAAYYCCWGFFPMGFVKDHTEKGGSAAAEAVKVAYPNWMPPVFSGGQEEEQEEYVRSNGVPKTVLGVGARAGHVEPLPVRVAARAGETQIRKRGRPRKRT